MTTSYASRTRVPIEKTKGEIERLIRRYGAKGFATGWQGDAARVEFLCAERHIRISVIVPSDSRAASEQVARQRWRALLLVIKAKLESIDAGIASFESAFLADIVMPDGRTVYESTREPIRLAYESRTPVALLGGSQ
jgi:hypothetical protein